jgi:hypothetical protein
MRRWLTRRQWLSRLLGSLAALFGRRGTSAVAVSPPPQLPVPTQRFGYSGYLPASGSLPDLTYDATDNFVGSGPLLSWDSPAWIRSQGGETPQA